MFAIIVLKNEFTKIKLSTMRKKGPVGGGGICPLTEIFVVDVFPYSPVCQLPSFL